MQMKRNKREGAPMVPGRAVVPPSGRGGGGSPSMHTLAVLRRTNCFSLRQISCKSRLRRQRCPGLPGRRDGRQADGVKGRDGGRGGGVGEPSVRTRGALKQDGGGRRDGGGGGRGGAPMRMRETRREKKKLQHFKRASLSSPPSLSLFLSSLSLSLSLRSSIVQVECLPHLPSPIPSEAQPSLHSIPSTPPSSNSQISAPPTPPCSFLLHRFAEKWRKDETPRRRG